MLQESDANQEAPVHLMMLLQPHFAEKR